MGIYATQCPTCKEMHQWFSGSADQRCTNCRSGPPPLQRYNGEPLPRYDVKINSVPRTFKQVLAYLQQCLDERNYLCADYYTKELRGLADGAQHAQHELTARLDQVDRLQQMLDVQEIKMRKMDQLESELRQSQRLLGAYIKVAGRRYKRIAELEDTLRNVRLAAGLTPTAPGPIMHSDE